MNNASDELRRLNVDNLRRLQMHRSEPTADEGWSSYPAEREAVAELMKDREHPDYDESWRL